MNTERTFFSREHRFSLGLEHDSGEFYASFPVTNGIVDYAEFYALTPDEYERFLVDEEAALAFVEEARRHEHDELLLQQPGWNRGIPS